MNDHTHKLDYTKEIMKPDGFHLLTYCISCGKKVYDTRIEL